MAPETIAAVMGAVGIIGGAAVTSGPSYLASRRTRRAAREEGEATRDAVGTALDIAVARIEGRIEGAVDELRAGLHEVRDWQTSHTAEHVLIDHDRRNPTNDE